MQQQQRPHEKKSGRFGAPLSELELNAMSTPFVPKLTKCATSWSVNLFKAWVKHRNEHTAWRAYLEDILEMCLDPIVLERCLAYFVVEGTCNTKGEPFKPDTIYQILCGLFRYMRSIHGGEKVPNFLNKRMKAKRLHAVTDRHYRKLREVGIGGRRRHAEVFTPEEETSCGPLGH